MQWTWCRGEERHGGDRGRGGGHNGQGVTMRRDIDVLVDQKSMVPGNQ